MTVCLPNLPFDAIEPPRVFRPDRNEFMDHVARAEPFVLEGCIDHWSIRRVLRQLQDPADQLTYLSDLMPRQKVSFTHIPEDQGGALGFNEKLEQNFSFRSRRTLFSEFATLCAETLWNPRLGALYMQSVPLPSLTPKLGSLDLFEGFRPLSLPRFWIGTGGHTVGLHNDPFRNVLMVLAGAKRVTLFPPDELPNLYMAPIDRRIAGVFGSLVNVKKPDHDTFPRLRSALSRARVVTLEPGDVLYLPPFWWHHVESFGLNIGINCWFRDELGENVYDPSRELMLALRHAPLEERETMWSTFSATMTGHDGAAPPAGTPHRKAYEEARRLRKVTSSASLPKERDQMRGWILAFARWGIFRLEDPFPTLAPGEADRMLERLSTLKQRLLRRLAMMAFRVMVRLLASRFRTRHGIVPTSGQPPFRMTREHLIRVGHDGDTSQTILLNRSLGGAYVATRQQPPPPGTPITLLKNDIELRGKVVWPNARNVTSPGFGIRWDDPEEAERRLARGEQPASEDSSHEPERDSRRRESA